MVEIKLQSIAESNIPKDCYVSVRVGEVQKLSRLGGQKSYKFPQAADKKFGKIEVFRRIGAASFDLQVADGNARDINISCGDAGFGDVTLQVDVGGKGQSAEVTSPSKGGSKAQAAKDYLSKHSLEVRLSEAMQAVLREKPEDPVMFLASKLAGGRSIAPSAAPSPSAATSFEPAPRGGGISGSPAAPLAVVPFAKYYGSSFRQADLSSVHKRFPAALRVGPPVVKQPVQQQPQLASNGFQQKPSVGTWLQSKPKVVLPASPAPAPVAKLPVAAAVLDVSKKPSVGTWLMARPKALSLAPQQDSTKQQATTLAAAPRTYFKKPSVGTWLMARPAVEEAIPQKKDRSEFQKLPSATSWLAPVPPAVRPPRTEAFRMLQGLRPPAQMSLDERLQSERVLTNALLELTGDLEGTYFPLPSSKSFPASPSGMSVPEMCDLRRRHLLFEAGAGEADGRGVFVANTGDVAAWVNQADHVHIRFIVQQGGADGATKVEAFQSALAASLAQEGHDFA